MFMTTAKTKAIMIPFCPQKLPIATKIPVNAPNSNVVLMVLMPLF